MVSMSNVLSTERRAQVVSCLIEGMSIRSTVRVTGVAKNTIVKLLVDLGHACAEFQDGEFQNLTCDRIECDEIWAFCYSKPDRRPVGTGARPLTKAGSNGYLQRSLLNGKEPTYRPEGAAVRYLAAHQRRQADCCQPGRHPPAVEGQRD